MSQNLSPHLARLQSRCAELESQLTSPGLYSDPARAQSLIREHRQVKDALQAHELWTRLDIQVREHTSLSQSPADPELAALATEELPVLTEQRDRAHRALLALLLPPDPNDSRNTIIEIRAGTGGTEAALFAADLFRMYQRFAERHGWTLEILDTNPSELGGYKEAVFSLSGNNVFRHLRFESGVHRVQRVPATESQGRIHTSTATVAVLPEAQEVDIAIKPEDLRIEVCRAGGPGGQGVNTTDSAVQILHKPTGLIVRCQDNRSQIKNRASALSLLRSRLLEQKQAEESAKYAAHRKAQVGTGDRNEKIRTYNFPQNRITDHRIKFTSHNLDIVLDGALDDLITELLAADAALKLEQLAA